jgi:hypothetical protein
MEMKDGLAKDGAESTGGCERMISDGLRVWWRVWRRDPLTTTVEGKKRIITDDVEKKIFVEKKKIENRN